MSSRENSSTKRAKTSHQNKCSPEALGGIRAMIECTVCHNVPMSPVQECEKGHIVCGPCSKRDRTCSCSTTSDEGSGSEVQFLPKLVPSYATERILREYQFTFPCHYKDCTVSLRRNDLKNHLVECRYRPFGCFETMKETNESCNGRMYNIISYHGHLLFDHEIQMAMDKIDFFQYRNLDDFGKGFNQGIHVSLIFDVKTFLGHTLCHKSKSVYFWVSVIGDESLAAQYKYQWTLKKPNAAPADYIWSLPVVPVHKHGFAEARALGRVALY